MVTFGTTLQALAIGVFAAWVLTTYPPAPGEFLWDLPREWLPAGAYIGGPAPSSWVDPMRADFTTGGIAALSTIAETEPDPDMLTSVERQQALDTWIRGDGPQYVLDWSRVDEALRAFLAPLDHVEQLHVEAADHTADPTVIAPWRTAGTIEHTGEIHLPELAGANA